MLKGRHIWILLLALLLLSACGSEKKVEINIGYQKNGTSLTLKNSKQFKEEVEQLGYKLTWSEFNTGSSILEALNAGSIVFAGAGDIPSLFALDKGSQFVYIGAEPNAPDTEGILVHGDSDIQSLEDLKGKKIAFNKASIAQYLLTKALHTVGLSIDDIEAVHLNPPDASIAFGKGDVDAWVVWDPYMAVAESQGHKILQNAEGIVPYRSFYYSTRETVEEHEELVRLLIKHLGDIGSKINEQPEEVAKLMEKETKIDASVWVDVMKRRNSRLAFMDEQAVNDLQEQVEDLKEIGLIENAINIRDYVWIPE